MKKYFLLTFNEDWADEHNVPAIACFTEKQYNNWLKKEQETYAHLGNGGDCFLEELDDEDVTGQYLVDKDYVQVTEVDESFNKVFKKAGLSDLSLCSVFDNY